MSFFGIVATICTPQEVEWSPVCNIVPFFLASLVFILFTSFPPGAWAEAEKAKKFRVAGFGGQKLSG